MNLLQQLEQQFQFHYPTLYHQLYADGMLNWGTAGPNWITQQYPELRKNPPLLLFANEFELMSFDDIESQLSEFADPDYWMDIRADLHFIPFAKNGAGDMYCFLPQEEGSNEIPVVFLWHDANRAVYKAKNLTDFIFRSMLEAVADVEEAEDGLLQQENFADNLHHFLKTHGQYLSRQQQEIITDIYTRGHAEWPLISEDELSSLLQKEISWERLDDEFHYQNG
ncbi:SMI1/KNR4 family protein [Niastella sp. OAS944]|uniref:SMI1/KNR4 family protein n=1 Tax=Niastella sp. OAS944 TaxID=2664089 RepID=UPI0034847D10|nr:hypothetical protein [Chitinophagaceae bacterium OAS944]